MKLVLPLALLATLPLTAQTNAPAPADAAAAAPDNGIAVPPPPPGPSSDLTIPPPALSPDPFSDPLIVKIVVRYEKAWQGDRKETRSLTADLERWSKDEPGNCLLLAYLGSAYALDSRDAWIGPGKLTYLQKAGKSLDDAVNGDPSNPAVRLLRAMNYYELPAMLGKHRAAYDDFEYLIAQLKGTLPMPFTLGPDSRQAIYYYAGLSEIQFGHPGDAREAWQAGLALGPQTKLGLKMQDELKKLK